MHVKWEFRTTDKQSKQTAFRQSFYINWIKRPWVASVLEGITKQQYKKNSDYYGPWMLKNANLYLESIGRA